MDILESWPDIEVSLGSRVDCGPVIIGGWEGVHVVLRQEHDHFFVICWLSFLARPLPPFGGMPCPPYIPSDPNMVTLRLVLGRLVPCCIRPAVPVPVSRVPWEPSWEVPTSCRAVQGDGGREWEAENHCRLYKVKILSGGLDRVGGCRRRE